MISAKINASKIDKAHLFKGEKGTYLDIILVENRDGPDQYGNDGFVCQGVSKEAKDRGERGPIIGNWRKLAPKTARVEKPTAATKPAPAGEPDDVPF